jgi:monoamine oxidase
MESSLTPTGARPRTAIVGGGLAGLHAAWLLEQAGEDHLLLEGRDRLGGRLLSVSAAPGVDPAGRVGAFDLGATWFWPSVQPGLDGLVAALGLRAFRQHEDGDVVVEGAAPGRTVRVPGGVDGPVGMRLVGGMASLVDALASRVPQDRLRLAHRARALRLLEDGVAVEGVDAAGRAFSHEVHRVLLAMPPRLAAATLAFEAPLPRAVASDWSASATWMAPHAKYLAVYSEPFWRDRGLSGGARSRSGPLVEIHDASSPGGPAALFGFVGVPAGVRGQVSDAELRRLCRAQLVRLFGDDAGRPVAEWLHDWSREPFTAAPADLVADGHPGRAALQVEEDPWRGRLVGIASEWSVTYPGYVAGAVEASAAGVLGLPGRDLPRAGRSAP